MTQTTKCRIQSGYFSDAEPNKIVWAVFKSTTDANNESTETQVGIYDKQRDAQSTKEETKP